MKNKIGLWLVDSEYRQLLKRRKALLKRQEVLEATVDRTKELLRHDPKKTHVTHNNLRTLQDQVSTGIHENLQLLHETGIAIKRKLGIDECDNG